jgi:hypothetical protein
MVSKWKKENGENYKNILTPSNITGSCMICKDKICKINSVFYQKPKPKPKYTDKAFSVEFAKEMCDKINKARHTAKMKGLNCNPNADSISWNRCEEMKDELKAVNANKEKRFKEWKAEKANYEGDEIE